MRDIVAIQAGLFVADQPYVDVGKMGDDPLLIFVHVHDTTDDIMLTTGNQKGVLDIEVTFDNARLLIEALQDAVERKGHPPLRPPDPPYNIPR